MVDTKSFPMAEYEDACDCNTGYCTTCEAFVGDSVEPDAEGYTCPDCGEDTLMGAEEALLQGLIEVDGLE